MGDHYVSLVSDLGQGVGWVAAGAAMAWLGGRRGRRAGLATVFAALGTSYLVEEVIKPVAKRKRPFAGRDIVVVGIKPEDASFPSGHTASSFAAATAVSSLYPKAGPLAFVLATLVGISRVHLGHHFPSDVLIGSVIGVGTGTVATGLLKAIRIP